MSRFQSCNSKNDRRETTAGKMIVAGRLLMPAANPLPLIVFICALQMLINPAKVHADDIELSASVDRNEVRIADPFQLEIRLLAPDGTQVSFPKIDKTIGPFELLSVQEKTGVPVPSNRPTQQRNWSQILNLETLDTGPLQIPSIEVSVAQPDQPQRVLRTEPITVNVTSIVEPSADLTQFRGIAELRDVELPSSSSFRWIWIGCGSAAAGLIAASVLLMKTRKKKAVSPLTWALNRLNQTHDLSCAEATVRQYIEERFDVAASSMSPEKILAHLQHLKVEDSVLRDLSELLQQAEQIKFSGFDFPETEEVRLVKIASDSIKRLDEHRGENG